MRNSCSTALKRASSASAATCSTGHRVGGQPLAQLLRKAARSATGSPVGSAALRRALRPWPAASPSACASLRDRGRCRQKRPAMRATSRSDRLVVSRGEILLKRREAVRGRAAKWFVPVGLSCRDCQAQAGSRGLLRNEGFQFANHRVSDRRLLLELDLVSMFVAIEEPSARGPETLPDCL